MTAGVLGGGLVAGIVVSQLGIATAASPSPSPRASGQPRPAMPFGGPRRFLQRLPGMAPFADGSGPGFGPGAGRVLHSEATVKKPDGTTEVVLSQSGLITDVSGSTMTVKSSDGFEATYTVDKLTRISLNGNDGALSKLKSEDAVHVVATKTGSTAHAESVIDGVPAGFMRPQKQRVPSAVGPSAPPST